VRLDLAALVPAVPATPPRPAPLVFDLQPPDLPREVIATPDDARTTKTPQKADFLSDKNALARNQEPAPLLPETGEPFSRGDLASHDLPPSPPLPEQPRRPEPARPEAQAGDKRESDSPDPEAEANAGRVAPREQKPDAAPRRPFRLELPGVPHKQLEGRAAEAGGLSFNTYDWDFAPYMLALKQRIGRNIFPPLAYTMLGMIDGDTMLRFKIYPNGRLADLELLGYSGHRTLMETSRSAITISAPFPALPADFPKPYLEVTARFSYFVKR
jgi:protein TonB